MDWKVVAALGGSAVLTVLALRMEPAAVKDAFYHLVDATKDCVVAFAGNR